MRSNGFGKRFGTEPDFSGILICSDFDGTLYSHGFAPADKEAIDYFISRGGLFSLATGRDGRWLSAGNLPFEPNAPGACENGAVIFDFASKDVVALKAMDDGYPAIISDLIAGMPLSRIDIVSYGLRTGFEASDPDDFRRALGRITTPVMKVVAYKKEPSEDYVPEDALRIVNGRANVLSNSKSCFELNAPGVDKASGVLDVKAFTGAELLITAGDCNGDVSMFGIADDSFAVGNAIPAIKKIAGHVTEATVREGAFPEIVESVARLYGGAV